MKKIRFLAMAVLLAGSLALLGCSDMMGGQPESAMMGGQPTAGGQSRSGIPSDLRNTEWSRQISETETVTICFRTNAMTMTSNIPSSQYNQEWEYLGANCCGYGYCRFYNDGGAPFAFSYSNGDNGLSITGANMRSMNGNWARK